MLRAETVDSAPTEDATAALMDLRATLLPILDALVDDETPPAEEWEALRRSMVLAREDAALPPRPSPCGGSPARTASATSLTRWRC